MSSSLYCRFSHCQWTGSEDDIFQHVELMHKKYLREPTATNYYDLALSDLQQETLALSSSSGLYWLCQHPLRESFSNNLVFGLFHIGQSECTEYTLKLGRDQHFGTFKTQTELNQCDRNKEIYDLTLPFRLLERLNERIPSVKLRLYLGDVDDTDDVTWPSTAEWDQMSLDERINSVCWKNLYCNVCSKFIRRDARFCENRHFVCLQCFNDLQQQYNNLKCPICLGIYEYDCSDDKLECYLRLLKWPDTPRNSKE